VEDSVFSTAVGVVALAELVLVADRGVIGSAIRCISARYAIRSGSLREVCEGLVETLRLVGPAAPGSGRSACVLTDTPRS